VLALFACAPFLCVCVSTPVRMLTARGRDSCGSTASLALSHQQQKAAAWHNHGALGTPWGRAVWGRAMLLRAHVAQHAWTDMESSMCMVVGCPPGGGPVGEPRPGDRGLGRGLFGPHSRIAFAQTLLSVEVFSLLRPPLAREALYVMAAVWPPVMG
jgi:hypothetical protein